MDEDDIDRIVPGQHVVLSFGSLDLTLEGAVGSVATIPTANPAARPGQSRKYAVKIPLESADQRVIMGLPVDVRIAVGDRLP